MNTPPIEILVIGTNTDILNTIAKLIKKNDAWRATTTNNITEAIAHCFNKSINLILLGAGLTENEEKELRAQLKNYKAPIVHHYGGGSGLLYAEIYQALAH